MESPSATAFSFRAAGPHQWLGALWMLVSRDSTIIIIVDRWRFLFARVSEGSAQWAPLIPNFASLITMNAKYDSIRSNWSKVIGRIPIISQGFFCYHKLMVIICPGVWIRDSYSWFIGILEIDNTLRFLWRGNWESRLFYINVAYSICYLPTHL